MQPLLLDTHAVIWLANDELISSASEKLDEAARASVSTLVSPITAWEVALLASRGRLNLATTPQRWFDRVLSFPGIHLTALSPEMLIASSFLPGDPPRDPADRILVATAREIGATLVTRDRMLLAYGATGHVSTLAC